MNLSEIIKKNLDFEKSLNLNYRVGVLSNITVNQLKHYLEYNLRSNNIGAICSFGDYDNILQEAKKFIGFECTVIFWELSNIFHGFNYLIEIFDDKKAEEVLLDLKNKLLFVTKAMENSPLVIFNLFSTSNFTTNFNSRMNYFCFSLNEYLKQIAPKNFILIDIDNIYKRISFEDSIDFRNYYNAKALYRNNFLKLYSNEVSKILLSSEGKSKKVLVFDCDNTLWKGIVGEDGVEGIECSIDSPIGSVFREVQGIAKKLANDGILICLCSKNNFEDVQEVFETKGKMLLDEKDIVLKKVNWNNKVSNLVEIANELNVGIDSFVFVDDSDFEVNLVKQSLPDVKVLQVPNDIYMYPSMIRDNINLFYKKSITSEDIGRVKSYKNQVLRVESEKSFDNLDEYINSLDLNLEVFIDNNQHIKRIAQLTQKTNQFNLTTRRYTEKQIDHFLNSSDHIVFSFSISDKFGDFGITSVVIVKISNHIAEIDTFLMSCRIIGRKIELQILEEILLFLSNNNIKSVKSKYIKSKKNNQVSNFYDNKFQVDSSSEKEIEYFFDISKFKYSNKLIKVNYGRKTN